MESIKSFFSGDIKQNILKLMQYVLMTIIEYYDKFVNKYGLLGVITAAAVIIKMLVFYILVGVNSYFVLVWFLSCFFIYSIFSGFKKNKWIPAVIFAIISILLFCDVTYCSFFNRYLSVNMLGAAGLVGDITESIKAVIRPVNFVMFIDAIMVFITLVKAPCRRNRAGNDGADGDHATSEMLVESESEEGDIRPHSIAHENNPKENETYITQNATEPEGTIKVVRADEALESTNNSNLWQDDVLNELMSMNDTSEADCEAEPQDDSETDIQTVEELLCEQGIEMSVIEPELLEILEQNQQIEETGRKRKHGKSKKSSINKVGRAISFTALQHKLQIISIIVVVLLVFNIGGGNLIQAISNQEIFSYHIKDIVQNSFATTGGNLVAFTDDYATEKEGPLFGVAAGRNVIVIQIESLQNFVIGREYNGQEITPNLNKLIGENTIYFDNYYQQVGSGNTSDAEFASNNSIYGTLQSYTYKLFDQNYFRGLPVQLKEKGYETAVLHAHEDKTFWNRQSAYKVLGFDRYYGGLTANGGDFKMTEWMGWGLTDSEFFPQAIEYIKELPQPFYSFVITLSNHHPYKMLDKYTFIDLLPEDEGTVVGQYIQSAAYTDYALGQFFQELKDAGLYDNSIIAMYGDHTGMAHSEEIDASMKKLLGKDYDFEELMGIPLIISLPNSQYDIHQTVSTAGGQLDFLPTMAYLLGFDTLDTIYLGHNLLTIKEGFVAEQTQMVKGSYFLNDTAYEMARDGVFENGRAWNIHTGERIKDLAPYYDGYVRSTDIINTSEYILKSDAIRQMFLEGKDADAIGNTNVRRIYPDVIADAGCPDVGLVATNSVEALQHSYDMGYRFLRLDIDWDTSEEVATPVTVNRRNGEWQMNSDEIISWFQEHPDAYGVMNVVKSGDYLINYIDDYDEGVAARMILELPQSSEYSGRYDAILDVSTSGQSVKDLKQFIQRNNVWAIVMDKADAEGRLSSLMKADTAVYVRNNDGTITKGN